MDIPRELILVISEKNQISKTFGKLFSNLDKEILSIVNKHKLWDNYIWDTYSIERSIRRDNLHAIKWLAKTKPLLFKAKLPEYALDLNTNLNMIKFLLEEKPQLLNDYYAMKCIDNVLKCRNEKTFEYLFPIYIEKFPNILYFIMRQICSWGAGKIAEWIVNNHPDHADYTVKGLVEFIRNNRVK